MATVLAEERPGKRRKTEKDAFHGWFWKSGKWVKCFRNSSTGSLHARWNPDSDSRTVIPEHLHVYIYETQNETRPCFEDLPEDLAERLIEDRQNGFETEDVAEDLACVYVTYGIPSVTRSSPQTRCVHGIYVYRRAGAPSHGTVPRKSTRRRSRLLVLNEDCKPVAEAEAAAARITERVNGLIQEHPAMRHEIRHILSDVAESAFDERFQALEAVLNHSKQPVSLPSLRLPLGPRGPDGVPASIWQHLVHCDYSLVGQTPATAAIATHCIQHLAGMTLCARSKQHRKTFSWTLEIEDEASVTHDVTATALLSLVDPTSSVARILVFPPKPEDARFFRPFEVLCCSVANGEFRDAVSRQTAYLSELFSEAERSTCSDLTEVIRYHAPTPEDPHLLAPLLASGMSAYEMLVAQEVLCGDVFSSVPHIPMLGSTPDRVAVLALHVACLVARIHEHTGRTLPDASLFDVVWTHSAASHVSDDTSTEIPKARVFYSNPFEKDVRVPDLGYSLLMRPQVPVRTYKTEDGLQDFLMDYVRMFAPDSGLLGALQACTESGHDQDVHRSLRMLENVFRSLLEQCGLAFETYASATAEDAMGWTRLKRDYTHTYGASAAFDVVCTILRMFVSPHCSKTSAPDIEYVAM